MSLKYRMYLRFRRVFDWLVGRWTAPLSWSLRSVRSRKEWGITASAFILDCQVSARQVSTISRDLWASDAPGFLVFGVGRDTRLWEAANSSGTTVYLEDNAEWADHVGRECPSADIETVHYATKAADATALLDRPDDLAMDLPPRVRDRRWQVVLVDAPAGDLAEAPGRMSSIYEAARLVDSSGVVFVHDYERPVERLYADHYFAGWKATEPIVGRYGTLRGFRPPDSDGRR